MNQDIEELDETEYMAEAMEYNKSDNQETTPLIAGPPSRNQGFQPSLLWLLPPFFFTAIMSGAAITPRLSLISNLLCRDYYASKDISVLLDVEQMKCNIPAISGQIARMSTSLNTVTGLLAAVTAAKYGVLSDRYGRRYPLMLAMIGSLANDLCYIIVAKYYAHLSIYFLIFGAICDGLTGSFMSSMAATYSYVTDIVPPAKRAVAFGYFQCCFYGGIAIGPTLGGYLVKRTNNVLIIFYLAMGIHAVFALYTIFILPESLSPARQQAAQLKHSEAQHEAALHNEANSVVLTRASKLFDFFNIFTVLSVFFPKNGRAVIRSNLMLLMCIDVCLLLNLGIFTVVILYGKLMFDWGDLEQGYLLSIIGGTRVVVLLAVLPVVVRLVRGKIAHSRAAQQDTQTEYPPHGADRLDIWLIRVAVLLEVAGFLSFAQAETSGAYYAAGGLSALAGIGMPTLSSALTKHVPSSQTGKLLGAVALMQSLNRVASPLFFGLLYSWTVSTHPATTFILMAILMALGFLFSLGLRPCSSDESGDAENDT